MSKSASYILSAYSFISTDDIETILSVGYKLEGGNPIPSFDESLLIDLCSDVQQIFSKEKNVLLIEGDVVVVGDIHGSFHDLLRILNYVEKINSKVLFLGDYVDRGNFSLECITILFALKVAHPDSFYLIRGNHEFDSICSKYGFKNEIISIQKSHSFISANNSIDQINFQIQDEYLNFQNNPYCYKYSEKLYSSFIRAFSYLPIAAIINKKTFCIHGGLSPKLDHADNLDDLIIRPVFDFESNTLLSDLVWSDPVNCTKCLFDKNPRGRGYLFNRESLSLFLQNNSFSRMVRAHQCVKNGSCVCSKGKCITIFSASSYDNNTMNPSSIVQFFQKDDTFKITTFPPLRRLQKCDALYYKVQSLNLTEVKIHPCFLLLNPTLTASKSARIFTNITPNQTLNNLYIKNNQQTGSPLLMKTKFITNRKKSRYVPSVKILFNNENENINEKIVNDEIS